MAAMLAFATQASAEPAASGGAGSALALLVLIVAIAGWLGLRALIRRFQVRKAERVVHGDFTVFALEALSNAAQLDRRIAAVERDAILAAMREIAGHELGADRVDAALAGARLSKDELVAYLTEKSRAFTREQKVQFLKALLGVFVADGRFEESEHHALIDYTAAVGFDREQAPNMLRGLISDMARSRIT